MKRPASADERHVAKKSMIKNPGKENFFLNAGGPPISRQFCPRFRSTTEINRFSWV
jgi:hypothetical protein